MLNDVNQDLLCLAYTTPKAWEEFLKEVKKKGLGVRLLIPFTINVPLDDGRYNETINFLKHIMNPISQRLIDGVTDNFFVKQILNKVTDKTGYRLLEGVKWDWKMDTKNKMIYTCITPVAVEYRKGYRDMCTTDAERRNYDRLVRLESDGFIPQSDKEAGISDDKMPEDMKKKLEEWKQQNKK